MILGGKTTIFGNTHIDFSQIIGLFQPHELCQLAELFVASVASIIFFPTFQLASHCDRMGPEGPVMSFLVVFWGKKTWSIFSWSGEIGKCYRVLLRNNASW